MNVYFKGYWNNQSKENNKLHKLDADVLSHQEAIMITKSWLEESKHNQTSPILCVINPTKEYVTSEAA